MLRLQVPHRLVVARSGLSATGDLGGDRRRRPPQCIERYNIAGLKRVVQINWLYLDLTSIASLEAFASRLVDAVDCALKCNGKLFDSTFKGVRSASAMMTAAVRLLKTHFCGIVVIDEIQFGNFAVGSAAALREWMLKIANVGIGLVFSGNPMGFRLELPRSRNDKKQNNDKLYATQVMRRLFATNKIRLDPALSADDPEWVAFTTGIRRCRLYGLAGHPLDLELEELKFKLTAGFHDFYVELHCSLEKILVKNPTKLVDAKLIELAARKSTKITEMQPLILAIYHQDPITLRCCKDVDCDYYEELWKGVRQAQTSTAQVGPVGVVVMPPSTANPEKSLDQDKNLAEKKKATKQAKASKELNPAAAAVRDFHIDKLGEMISGKAVDSESGD